MAGEDASLLSRPDSVRTASRLKSAPDGRKPPCVPFRERQMDGAALVKHSRTGAARNPRSRARLDSYRP